MNRWGIAKICPAAILPLNISNPNMHRENMLYYQYLQYISGSPRRVNEVFMQVLGRDRSLFIKRTFSKVNLPNFKFDQFRRETMKDLILTYERSFYQM